MSPRRTPKTLKGALAFLSFFSFLDELKLYNPNTKFYNSPVNTGFNILARDKPPRRITNSVVFKQQTTNPHHPNKPHKKQTKRPSQHKGRLCRNIPMPD